MIGHDPSNLVFALSAAVDGLVVGGVVLWAARRDPVGLHLVAGLAVAAAALAVKGVLMYAAGLEVPFGVMHVLWLDLVVIVPFAAVVLLVVAWHRLGGVSRGAALTVLLLVPLGAYASLVEPERLQVERAELTLQPAREGDRPVRLGVIADLQFEHLGDHEREAVDRLSAERPDVILLAGDYNQGSDAVFERELPGLKTLLRQLRAPGGVYAVQGDVEGPTEVRRVFAGTGVTLLLNEVAEARVGDRRLTIGGVGLKYRSEEAEVVKGKLEEDPSTDDVRILLSHRPDTVLDLPRDTRVDLVVAGHTHGGQPQIPFLGPPVTASSVPRHVAAGGLHRVSGHWIYVSRGVGVERAQAPRLRLGAVPEVALITLR